MSTPFIAVEWGTAGWRAMLVDASAVRDRAADTVKLQTLGRSAMLEIVAGICARWPSATGPIWLSGMIASEIGWRHVAQVDLPASIDSIAAGVVTDRIGDISVRLMPGLQCRNAWGDPDLLRGEEVAALGAICGASPGASAADAVLLGSFPGMHGKWMLLTDGGVATFHTAMTVELATLIERDSFLATVIEGPPAVGDAFRRGVMQVAGGGSTARLLFGARAHVVAGTLSRFDAASYVWGILIGADVAEAIACYGRPGLAVRATGAPHVADLYVEALRQLGVAAVAQPGETLAMHGFAAVRHRVSVATT